MVTFAVLPIVLTALPSILPTAIKVLNFFF
jgi:hypothetical protein